MGSPDGLRHERVRDVLQTDGKPAAKCKCGEFHPTFCDEMNTKVSIPPGQIKELNQKEFAPASEKGEE